MNQTTLILKKLKTLKTSSYFDVDIVDDINQSITNEMEGILNSKDNEKKINLIISVIESISDLFKDIDLSKNVELNIKKEFVNIPLHLIFKKRNYKILIEIFKKDPKLLKDLIEHTLEKDNEDKKEKDLYALNYNIIIKIIKNIDIELEIKSNESQTILLNILKYKKKQEIFNKLTKESQDKINEIIADKKTGKTTEMKFFYGVLFLFGIIFLVNVIQVFIMYKLIKLIDYFNKSLFKYPLNKEIDFTEFLLDENSSINDLYKLKTFKMNNPCSFDSNGVLINKDLFDINFKI